MLGSPFIKSLLIFFAITMCFDFASRTILKPKPKPKQTKSNPKSTNEENLNEESGKDMSFEEEVIKEGSMFKDENQMYELTFEFCECCGLRKQYELIKEKLEKYKNILVDEHIIGQPTRKKFVQSFFTILQFTLIALSLCKNKLNRIIIFIYLFIISIKKNNNKI